MQEGEFSTSMVIITEPYQRCSCSLYRHYATSQDICIASIRNLEEILMEVSKQQAAISSGIETVIENQCGTSYLRMTEERFQEKVARRDGDHSAHGGNKSNEMNKSAFSRARSASIFEMQIKRLNLVLGNQVAKLVQTQKSKANYDSELWKLANKREKQFEQYLYLLDRFKQMERLLQEKDDLLREKQLMFGKIIEGLTTENRALSQMNCSLELQRPDKSWLMLQECQVSLNELKIINGNLKSSLKLHEKELEALRVQADSIQKQNDFLKESMPNTQLHYLSSRADIFEKEISRLNRELGNQINHFIEVKQSLEAKTAQTSQIKAELKVRVKQFDQLNKELIQSKDSNQILINEVSCLRERLKNLQEQISDEALTIKSSSLIPPLEMKENEEPQNTDCSIPGIDRKADINLLRQRCADYQLKMTRLRKEFEKIQRRLRDYQEENLKLQKYRYDNLEKMAEA